MTGTQIELTDIGPFLTDDFLINFDYIKQLPKEPHLYINGASEHYGDGLLDNLAEAVADHTVLSHAPLPNCQFYPYWYYWAKQNWPQTYNLNIAQDRKQHKISCLNNSARPHRILNWIINLEKDILWSMHNDPAELGHDMPLTTSEKSAWNNIKSELPLRTHNSDEGVRVDADILHEAYTNSYVNFVTESTVCDRIFITEKTWKPIASGQLFLILGNPGTVKHLRDQGIDCFDDIIDHSYDSIKDPRERIYKLTESLDKLLTQDLFTLNLLTKQRRTKNAELFWSDLYELQ